MTVGHVGITTEVFPLWAYCKETDDKWLFAVTLNTGLVVEGVDPAVIRRNLQETVEALPGANMAERLWALFPWRWQITDVKLWVYTAANGGDEVSDFVDDARVDLVGTLPSALILNNDSRDGYHAALEAYLAKISRDDEGTAWQRLEAFRLNLDVLREETEEFAGDALGLLANLATWPAPLAHMVDATSEEIVQGTNMALLVAVDRDALPQANGQPDPRVRPIAAPVYDGITFNPDTPDPLAANGPAVEWPYRDNGQVARMAHCGGARLDRPKSVDVQYDPNTYFVCQSDQGLYRVLGRNPLSDLEFRVAERFELADFLVSNALTLVPLCFAISRFPFRPG